LIGFRGARGIGLIGFFGAFVTGFGNFTTHLLLRQTLVGHGAIIQ